MLLIKSYSCSQIESGRLVSGDVKGDVIITDMRMSDDSIHKITAHQSRPLNALAVHDYCPLIARYDLSAAESVT